jgi:hypothetical protein
MRLLNALLRIVDCMIVDELSSDGTTCSHRRVIVRRREFLEPRELEPLYTNVD